MYRMRNTQLCSGGNLKRTRRSVERPSRQAIRIGVGARTLASKMDLGIVLLSIYLLGYVMKHMQQKLHELLQVHLQARKIKGEAHKAIRSRIVRLLSSGSIKWMMVFFC